MSNIMCLLNCFVSRVVRITVEEHIGKHWRIGFAEGHTFYIYLLKGHTSICLDRPIENKIHENIVFSKNGKWHNI